MNLWHRNHEPIYPCPSARWNLFLCRGDSPAAAFARFGGDGGAAVACFPVRHGAASFCRRGHGHLPDHLHSLWRLPSDDANYSERWRQIKRFVSIGAAVDKNRRGEKALWQRRYCEHVVRDEEDWRRHCDYIHYNPVKHRYVALPTDWPHSSFAHAVAQGWYEPGWGDDAPPGIAVMDYG